jgi:heme/copper-type cytochrome/quinol oxidase subunit 2
MIIVPAARPMATMSRTGDPKIPVANLRLFAATPGPMMDHVQMMDNSMMGHDAPSATVPGARQVGVSSTSFSFTPDEIHVRANDDVTIVLTAADIAHDFTIDELDVHVAASPGQTGRGGLHAPATSGRYTAYCSVAGHRSAGMTATVVVDSD